MTPAANAARDLMIGYYDRCGEELPAIDADELIGRIRIRNGRWENPIWREQAEQILNRSFFDVDDLVENHLSIRLIIRPLYEYDVIAGAPVFGLARPASREVTICERAEGYEPLYRTTVVHEVAHVVLPSLSRPRPRVLSYSPSSPQRPKEEKEADEFMHTAILPLPVLELGIAWIAEMHGLNLHDALAGANTGRGRFQWREVYFQNLIDSLCVSRHLIAIKLKGLGVFSEATLRYHLSYPLPNRWRKTSQWRPLRAPLRKTLSKFGELRQT